MGEEVKTGGDYEAGGEEGAGGDDDDDCVLEWEVGLPSADDLTPLSQQLIPPELASAFSITPDPCRTMLEVNRSSQDTLSSLRGQSQQQQALSSNNSNFNFNFNFKSFNEDRGGGRGREATVVEGGDDEMRKLRTIESGGVEEEDSILRAAAEDCTDDSSARTLKRPRLVWTPQLHKRFVDVVAHLGIKNAVPKTIMQLMNVEGLTRENVASHLQKYRLYLKRMQGLSSEGPSSSDHLFASTPVPQSLHESSGGGGGSTRHGHNNGHVPVPVPVPIPLPYPPQMIPMQVLGMAHGHGHMGMPVGSSTTSVPYPGFESLRSYNMVQQRDWSGNKFGSVASYHNGTSNEK